MNLKAKALILALMILALTIPAPIDARAAAEGQEDPAVITVGRISYPLSLVQFSLDSAIDAASALGEELTEEDCRRMLEQTIERLTGLAVIENKLMEHDLYEFTVDEREILMANAQQQYEMIWQEFMQKAQENGEAVTEEQCTQWLNEEGYTVDALTRELELSERELRIMAYYCADVTVSDEETQQFYLDTYVNPDREKYEHNVDLYEKEILIPGNEAFFVPEGYRYVKHILLDWPETLMHEIRPFSARLNRTQDTLKEKYQALADAAAAAEKWEDLAAEKAAFAEAKADYEEAREAFLRKRDEAPELLKETIDGILRRARSGESFEKLMREYSIDKSMTAETDPGFSFHPDSSGWPETFRDAAAALEKPGDISEPVVTDAGVHIIRYQSDIPGGIHQLTAEEQETLREAALLSAKRSRLEKMIREWITAYRVEVHPEYLQLK